MTRLVLLLLACAASSAALAERPLAELSCRFTGTDFVYDCVIRLTRAGRPLDGVQLVLGADMPSMPMAHNIAPVQAARGARPGEYRARLDLEMTGEWAVKLRLSGAVRDQIVLHYEFDESGARPARARADPAKGGATGAGTPSSATRPGTPPRR